MKQVTLVIWEWLYGTKCVKWESTCTRSSKKLKLHYDNAEIKIFLRFSNLVPVAGSKEGKGGIYNFVTKRELCETNAKISWPQVDTGSPVTWKYPWLYIERRLTPIGEFIQLQLPLITNKQILELRWFHLGKKHQEARFISKGIFGSVK